MVHSRVDPSRADRSATARVFRKRLEDHRHQAGKSQRNRRHYRHSREYLITRSFWPGKRSREIVLGSASTCYSRRRHSIFLNGSVQHKHAYALRGGRRECISSTFTTSLPSFQRPHYVLAYNTYMRGQPVVVGSFRKTILPASELYRLPFDHANRFSEGCSISFVDRRSSWPLSTVFWTESSSSRFVVGNQQYLCSSKSAAFVRRILQFCTCSLG